MAQVRLSAVLAAPAAAADFRLSCRPPAFFNNVVNRFVLIQNFHAARFAWLYLDGGLRSANNRNLFRVVDGIPRRQDEPPDDAGQRHAGNGADENAFRAFHLNAFFFKVCGGLIGNLLAEFV